MGPVVPGPAGHLILLDEARLDPNPFDARAEVLADPATAGHEAGGMRERIWRQGWAVRRRRFGVPVEDRAGG